MGNFQSLYEDIRNRFGGQEEQSVEGIELLPRSSNRESEVSEYLECGEVIINSPTPEAPMQPVAQDRIQNEENIHVDIQSPEGVTTQAQPGGVTSQAQPEGVTTQAQPGGVTSQAQPEGVTTQAQPGGVTSEAQHEGVTTQAQPGKVTPQMTEQESTEVTGGATETPPEAIQPETQESSQNEVSRRDELHEYEYVRQEFSRNFLTAYTLFCFTFMTDAPMKTLFWPSLGNLIIGIIMIAINEFLLYKFRKVGGGQKRFWKITGASMLAYAVAGALVILICYLARDRHPLIKIGIMSIITFLVMIVIAWAETTLELPTSKKYFLKFWVCGFIGVSVSYSLNKMFLTKKFLTKSM